MTQQAIPETEPTWKDALLCPTQFECLSCTGDWRPYEVWQRWAYDELTEVNRKWRRIPNPKREPMRYDANTYGHPLEDGLVVGQDNGHYVGIRLRLPYEWRKKRARITVTELLGGHSEPKPVDIDPPAEMDADAAMHWLRADRTRRVVDRQGDVWWFDSEQQRFGFNNTNYHNYISKSWAPFTPLVPLTRGQLAEIERITKRVNELVDCHEQDKKLISEARTRLLDAATERDDARTARDSALGSQKAALAALEQERAKCSSLRSKLQVVRNWFENDVNNLRGRDVELSRSLNETAPGKESGG